MNTYIRIYKYGELVILFRMKIIGLQYELKCVCTYILQSVSITITSLPTSYCTVNTSIYEYTGSTGKKNSHQPPGEVVSGEVHPRILARWGDTTKTIMSFVLYIYTSMRGDTKVRYPRFRWPKRPSACWIRTYVLGGTHCQEYINE